MAEASIPVNLFNPGEVFACLGLLEAAEILVGEAEGGFDWSTGSNARFRLRAEGGENPVGIVLGFLAEAEVCRVAPTGYADPPKNRRSGSGEGGPPERDPLELSDLYPAREGDRMSLPIRLAAPGWPSLDVSHWADGSSRETFKLYSGNRSAFGIALAMLRGKGAMQGVRALWMDRRAELLSTPFGTVTLMAGSFNFDPRGAWTALDAGYSPDQHQSHAVAASPAVEVLAALGMEHARPDEYEKRKVRYAAWGGFLPPMLARPALSGMSVTTPMRRFCFTLQLSGKNKVVTFAQEEASA
jgi:CRISPR-associated protein Csx14